MAITADMPYEALYAEHAPAARRLALALVPAHVADDVVSEAFTKVMAATGRNGPPLSFRPYWLAAVRNTANSYHTRGRRLVPVADPEPAPAASAESVVSDREDARLAAQAFRSLPERWRQVLWATAVEEIPVADLAQRWGMAPNAVSQLASRAREGLRQQYLTANLAASVPLACRQVAPYMGAAVRGRASRRHERVLSAHLGQCGRCSQAFAGLGALNNNLGALLLPAAAVSWGLARTAARTAGRGWHLAPLAFAGVAVSLAGAAALPFVTAHPGAQVQLRTQASAPAAPGHVAPVTGRTHVPRHAKQSPAGLAAGTPAPAASLGTTSAVPAAGGTVRPVTTTAGAAVSSLGAGAGRAVAGTGQAAGQAVSGITSAVPVPAVSGAGQAAGGAVSGVTGSAGQLVQDVTGSVGGVLGGL